MGILKDGLAEIRRTMAEGGMVIFDWGSGLAAHRHTALAATLMNRELSESGVDIYSFVVTTRAGERMAEAARIAKSNSELLPDGRTIVVLNEVAGDFAFGPGSDAEKTFKALRAGAGGVENMIKMPRVGGEALKVVAPTGLDIPSILTSRSHELASQLRMDGCIVNACLAHLQQFHDAMEDQLSKLFSFRLENHAA